MTGSVVAKRALVALVTVAILTVIFALCLVSAIQLLVPRDMPFGVTESSPIVDAAGGEISLSVITYADEADLLEGAEQGDIYGGYVADPSGDKLITVPAKSFFGEVYVSAAFAEAAKSTGGTYTTSQVAPLPTADRTGAVVGLLLLPTLVGGYVIASLLFSASQKAAAPGRIAIVFAFAAAVAIITGVTAGPIIGAFPTSYLVPLTLAFFLVTSAVGLSAVAIQTLVGKLGTLLVALLFIIVGGAGAGGAGVALLPTYWQKIGVLFPPRHAIELYRNVRYFDGNNIGQQVAILGAYVVVSLVVIVLATRRSSAASAPAGEAESIPTSSRRRLVPKDLLGPVVFSLILSTLFAVNYMSSGHEPVANEMPFGVVGSPALAEAAQNNLFDLDILMYEDQDAATEAMDKGEIYGALITTDSSTDLTIVNSISDVSPLDIAANFEAAARDAGVTISLKAYAPTPLAAKDPAALVISTLLVTLLVGGYMSAALLASAIGTASGRWRGLLLAGFAIVTGLLLDVIVTFWLEGLPSESFWIAWPIISLIIVTIGLFAAVMRRVLGPTGIVVTLVVMLQFGNPSSGGANGAPYLTDFWDAVGPFLPPRNAYVLLRNTVYFGGNGIGQALTVLLVYTAVGAAILTFLNWFRSPEVSVPGVTGDDATAAATVAIPIGPVG